MRNLFGRTVKGLCRLYLCYSCNLTVCRRFLLPRELVDDRCPMCEAIYWYKGPPVFEDLEKCDCYVQPGNSFGRILFPCTIVLFLDYARGADYMIGGLFYHQKFSSKP